MDASFQTALFVKGTKAYFFFFGRNMWVVLKVGLEAQKQQLVGFQNSLLPLQMGKENSER